MSPGAPQSPAGPNGGPFWFPPFSLVPRLHLGTPLSWPLHGLWTAGAGTGPRTKYHFADPCADLDCPAPRARCAVTEFRDWLRHTGQYDADTGKYAGQGAREQKFAHAAQIGTVEENPSRWSFPFFKSADICVICGRFPTFAGGQFHPTFR